MTKEEIHRTALEMARADLCPAPNIDAAIDRAERYVRFMIYGESKPLLPKRAAKRTR